MAPAESLPNPSRQNEARRSSGHSAISGRTFLARSFRNLDDLNEQLRDRLDTVANVRLHGTTQKIVIEALAEEQPELQSLPPGPFDALLKLERRVSHDGLVSVGGNYYSVPD